MFHDIVRMCATTPSHQWIIPSVVSGRKGFKLQEASTRWLKHVTYRPLSQRAAGGGSVGDWQHAAVAECQSYEVLQWKAQCSSRTGHIRLSNDTDGDSPLSRCVLSDGHASVQSQQTVRVQVSMDKLVKVGELQVTYYQVFYVKSICLYYKTCARIIRDRECNMCYKNASNRESARLF